MKMQNTNAAQKQVTKGDEIRQVFEHHLLSYWVLNL
jgi:hypothetical protein